MKQPLAAYAKTDPNVRRDGRPLHGDPAGDGHAARAARAARDYLRGFVEEMKASGFVADALKRSNQPDAAVAPPA